MAKGYRSRRKDRVKACELAALIASKDATYDGARLMSLCVFFESFIATGANATEKMMHLLRRKKVKGFEVVAGGTLGEAR